MNLRSLIALLVLFVIPVFVSKLLFPSNSGKSHAGLAVVSRPFDPQYLDGNQSAIYFMGPSVSAWLKPDENMGWSGVAVNRDIRVSHEQDSAAFHPGNIDLDRLTMAELESRDDDDATDNYAAALIAEAGARIGLVSPRNSPFNPELVPVRNTNDGSYGNIAGRGGILGGSENTSLAPEPRSFALIGLSLVGIGMLRKTAKGTEPSCACLKTVCN